MGQMLFYDHQNMILISLQQLLKRIYVARNDLPDNFRIAGTASIIIHYDSTRLYLNPAGVRSNKPLPWEHGAGNPGGFLPSRRIPAILFLEAGTGPPFQSFKSCEEGEMNVSFYHLGP
jgi:hypothetical protein